MAGLACSHCRRAEAEDQPIKCVVLGGGPCSACKERATIRQKIKQLEEEIADLEAKDRALGSHINAIHDPFIHKLPSEIGSHIFRLSLPTFDFWVDFSERREFMAGPLRLGAVCREWRKLAWATPYLWDTLYISIRPSTGLLLAKSLPGLLREWLGRSGTFPLAIFFQCFDIEIDFLNSYEDQSDDENDNENENDNDNDNDNEFTSDDSMVDTLEVATASVIKVLISRCGQWRNLYLKVDADILECFSGRTRLMQLFALQVVLTGEKRPTQKFIMESKPKHLGLTNLPLTLIDIGRDNITHATLNRLTVDDCIEFLQRAPDLEHYRVHLADRDFTSIRFDTPILHSQLRSFHISTRHPTANLLNIFTLPSLEEWSQNVIAGAIPVMPMLSLFERSKCCLKVLNLDTIQMPSEDLNILLQAIPSSLESLRLTFWDALDNCAVMDSILTRILHPAPAGGSNILAEDAMPEPLLPHLQFIECTAHFQGPLLPWDRIPQLYCQSNRRSLVLKSTVLDDEIRDETALQLLQLVDEGVDLQILDQTTGNNFLENFRNRMHKQSL